MSVRPQRVNADRRERGENMRSMSRARMIYRLVRGRARLEVKNVAPQPGLHALGDEDGDEVLTDSPDPKLDYITRLAVQASRVM